MRRREFIAGLGGVAVAWPRSAQAQQQTTVPVVGYLSPQSTEDDYKMVTVPFLQGLKETSYVEGQNVAVEYRYAENQFDRLPALAADLVRRRVAVIVAIGIEAAMPAKAATTIIPIVFGTGADPVATGLVAGLNRPGANLSGTAILINEVAPKRLELLRQLIPNAARFGVLADPAAPYSQSLIADLQAAAEALKAQADALYVMQTALVNANRTRIIALALGARLPTICNSRDFVQVGALMSYGPSYSALFRRAAELVDKILRGTKPADIPVEQPTRFEYVINLKTAKALGLTVPETLLATADDVIQ